MRKDRLSKKELKDYTNMLSDILGLKFPKVHVDSEMAEAGACLYKGEIYLNMDSFREMADEVHDTCYYIRFALAHEFRHYWQICCLGLERFEVVYEETDYNVNFLEIDANAFAALILTQIFGYTDHVGVPDEAIDAVRDRMFQIYFYEPNTRDKIYRYEIPVMQD